MQQMIKAFNNVLLVVKQTPFESYTQLKNQGKAPVALRWERLQNRYQVHQNCVASVETVLKNCDIRYHRLGREELHRGMIQGRDLVIAVGGDGTVLNTSSFIDDSIPVLGINSDPTRPEEQGVTNVKDERRSRGALCAISANNLTELLPRILYGEISPGLRTRIQCLVRSTYTETRLPPALNDILVSHPIPAAISRFRLALCRGRASPSFKTDSSMDELFSFNVWSSGLWISTATGSTAAMHAAGGTVMDIRSRNLQYMVREHLVEESNSHQRKASHGIIRPDEMLGLRWSSQHGCIFVDGSHFKHELELGDELKVDSQAPFLRIFDPI
jgi:NAD+ kinase